MTRLGTRSCGQKRTDWRQSLRLAQAWEVLAGLGSQVDFREVECARVPFLGGTWDTCQRFSEQGHLNRLSLSKPCLLCEPAFWSPCLWEWRIIGWLAFHRGSFGLSRVYRQAWLSGFRRRSWESHCTCSESQSVLALASYPLQQSWSTLWTALSY